MVHSCSHHSNFLYGFAMYICGSSELRCAYLYLAHWASIEELAFVWRTLFCRRLPVFLINFRMEAHVHAIIRKYWRILERYEKYLTVIDTLFPNIFVPLDKNEIISAVGNQQWADNSGMNSFSFARWSCLMIRMKYLLLIFCNDVKMAQ